MTQDIGAMYLRTKILKAFKFFHFSKSAYIYNMKSKAYEAVYNQIISKLAQGVVPWKKPWKTVRPCNAKTGRPYHGINFFLLTMSEYSDNRWITYKQVKDMGGDVKPGEKSCQVIYWQMLSKEEDGKKKNVPLLKYFNVFNVEQTEGVDWSNGDEEVTQATNPSAEDLLKNYANKPEVKHGGNRAYYNPAQDFVQMPPKDKFKTLDNYYSTLLHELVHSTGHKDRLNRSTLEDANMFGDANYSEEELIAEFGAAFLCNVAGIDNTIELSASYIDSWMASFKNTPSMIVSAASKAQKAADYILGLNAQGE